MKDQGDVITSTVRINTPHGRFQFTAVIRSVVFDPSIHGQPDSPDSVFPNLEIEITHYPSKMFPGDSPEVKNQNGLLLIKKQPYLNLWQCFNLFAHWCNHFVCYNTELPPKDVHIEYEERNV